MSQTLTLAALQTHYGMDLEDNIARTVDLVRQAAAALLASLEAARMPSHDQR